MTQSGQGEDGRLPSARPAREGIVLPADGSAPVLPGSYPQAPAPAPVPAGGTPWGSPWGPDAHGQDATGAGQAPGTGQGYWDAAPGGQDWENHQSHQNQQPHQDHQSHQPHQNQPHQPQGAQPHQGGHRPDHQDEQSFPGRHALPAGSHAAPQAESAGYPRSSQPYPAQGLPSGGQVPDADATQLLPPTAAGALPPAAPGALPPESPAESTQFLGRAPGRGTHAGAPQHAAPGMVPGAGDSEATQFLPPTPAAEAVHPDNQPTQFMAPVAAAPEPPQGTSYGIRPGAPGERQPPAEFDSLFRADPDAGTPGATQQMPRIAGRGQSRVPRQPAAPYGRPDPYPQREQYAQQDGYGPSDPYAQDGSGQGGGRRGGGRSGGSGRSRAPLIAAVGIGIVVLGVGAGALLSGGGDDKKDDSRNVSAETTPGDETPSPSADPARAQAVELDKLLGDSSSSRGKVVSAVSHVKDCKQLDQSATDLRDAAKQRNGLVTRLSALSVDQLPGHEQLTESLKEAWQASAAADNHYARWADQTKHKGACHKGHAKVTPQVAAGNAASGDASKAKTKAAGLWNVIAKKYGLTTRQPSQL